MSTTPPVTTDVRDAVGWVTLNLPEQRNVITRELLESLCAALEEMAEREDVRAVVLTGAGKAFSAGGDLSAGLDEITGKGTIAHQVSELRRFMRSSQLLAEMPKPTIAAVNGAVAGASLSLACCSDIRVASTAAFFVTGFVTVGVSGDFGGTWGLSRAIGPGLARELYLTGRRVDAGAALQMGLVSHVWAANEFLERTQGLAVELAGKAPLAVRAIKDNFNSLPASLADVLELEARHDVECTNTEDATEARLAFLEKRKPVFRHA